jgi:hypothetical protein
MRKRLQTLWYRPNIFVFGHAEVQNTGKLFFFIIKADKMNCGERAAVLAECSLPLDSHAQTSNRFGYLSNFLIHSRNETHPGKG